MKIFVASILTLIVFSLNVRAAEHGYETDTAPSQVTSSDTLRVWQNFWALTGFKYAYRGHEEGVSFAGGNIKEIVAANPDALREANTFGKYQAPTFIATLAFAAALGWGIGSKNDTLIVISSGGIVVSFIFDQIGYSHLKKAVSIYNEGLE